jgi:hypothetical protein
LRNGAQTTGGKVSPSAAAAGKEKASAIDLVMAEQAALLLAEEK